MKKLGLVPGGQERIEKRVFPRFPFSSLTFRSTHNNLHTFEVRDISLQGMHLGLKVGEHGLKDQDSIAGQLHWQQEKVEIKGHVAWSRPGELGVRFQLDDEDELKQLLCPSNLARGLRPLHSHPLKGEMLQGPTFWLQTDGPVEIFVYCDSGGTIARFCIVLMDRVMEYIDGKGLFSAKVLKKRDLETPLHHEDEYQLKFDNQLDVDLQQSAALLVQNMDSSLLPEDVFEFLTNKLR